MVDVIVHVATKDDDRFVSVDEDVFKAIASRLTAGVEPGLLDRMRSDFWKAATPATVRSTSSCDYCVVLDGEEDEASWRENLELWEAELDG